MHYLRGDGTVGHHYMTRNKGMGTARRLHRYVELYPGTKILRVEEQGIPADLITSGIGESSIELYWEKLPPGGLIAGEIISETPEDIRNIPPKEERVWYQKGRETVRVR